MDNTPSEVVFSANPSSTESVVFQYTNGPIKVAPRRRGRPAGSNKRKQTSKGIPKHGVAAPQFEFINIGVGTTDITEETRKIIRSRAMLSHGSRNQKRRENNGDTRVSLISTSERTYPRLVPSPTSHMDPFDTLPIVVEPYMHDLLSYYITAAWETLYSIEKRGGCNPIHDYWAPIVCGDAAMLHVTLGCATLLMKNVDRKRVSPVFIRHIGQATDIIHERLALPAHTPSDETLVAIASMAVAKKVVGLHDQWVCDMRILKALVDLRGGLDAFNDKPLVQGKIYRADLCGSIDVMQTPTFGTRFWQLPISDFTSYRLGRGFQMLDSLLHLEDMIKTAISNLQNLLAVFANVSKKSNHADVAKVRFWLTSTQYALLSIQYDIQCDPWNQAQETCRLALLLSTLTIFDESPPGASSSNLLVTRLVRLLDDDTVTRWLTPEFRLWAFFLATCNSTRPGLKEFCIRHVSKLVAQIGVRDKEEFTQQLSVFLHDPRVHETHLSPLWNEVELFDLVDE
ncbi:hypothetical protein BO70DRAFT_374103 [Aspergillus heteromorphus CBS 117.55]|uniref:Uncharacterized protein n=1 Tax=Aspergillus heteromorphus CBS 117.55 TaxID=1448321 RepID=A0A317V915_9EURO|nr:uncharacterized protein BO70DRAFT_374103 [Aspergillus heteromorphus CBS 117.55]PWY69487.1 hypothetical protein BO70DRAFT_374103 [Aspergillus heteromorphus CBS 117.55]